MIHVVSMKVSQGRRVLKRNVESKSSATASGSSASGSPRPAEEQTEVFEMEVDCGPPVVAEPTRCEHCGSRLSIQVSEGSSQTESDVTKLDHTYAAESPTKERQKFHFGVQCRMPTFTFHLLKDREVQFFTGVTTEKFLCLVLILKAVVAFGFPGKMNIYDQILLVLMKLRLNCLYGDLAHRFGVSSAQVGSIFRFWVPKMAEELKELIVWLPKDSISASLPNSFKAFYPGTTCIIDCTEVFVDRARNMNARALTYSNYKHHNTFKFLVAVSPNGVIMYVSPCWGGRTSDKLLVNSSSFYSFLQPGDEVMADRGFTIEEELRQRGVKLNIPSFTRGKRQLSEVDVTRTRRIASVRIEVERVIGKMKNFRILKSSLPLVFHKMLDHIVVICAALCNAQPSITRC